MPSHARAMNARSSVSAAIGAPVYTISLGASFDPQYLEDIADATGGEYEHAPTNAELELAANWTRVYENKNVRIVAIEHNN